MNPTVQLYNYHRKPNLQKKLHTLFLLGSLGDCIASSMAVLVARDILQDTAYSGNTLLLSLPLVANTLWSLAGSALFATLSTKIFDRRMVMLTQIPTCLFYILMAISVVYNNYVLFTVFIFIASFFIQPSISLGSTLPLRLTDEDSRAKANESMATAGVSAGSLGVLIAGYVATVFGIEFVYVTAAILPLLCIILAKAILPNEAPHRTISTKTASSGNGLIRFISNPQLIILIICIVGTLAVSSGYKNYLFPLILADNGFFKSDFASVFVVCNAIAFFLSPMLSSAGSRMGYRRLAGVSLTVLSLAYLGFILNNMLAWSVVVLVVALICDKVATPCWKTLWPRTIDDHCVTNEQGYAIVDGVDKAFDSARAPIWGALSMAGQTIACLMFGAFTALAAAVFMFMTRNGPFSKKR